MAVGQMSAVGQLQCQNGVSGIYQGKVCRHIGLRSAVRLHVCVFGAKELLGAFDGEAFHFIDVFATAVVASIKIIIHFTGLFAPAIGIALGIFVCKYAALGFHHREGRKVLAGNQLQIFLLPAQLFGDCGKDFGILFLDVFHFLSP